MLDRGSGLEIPSNIIKSCAKNISIMLTAAGNFRVIFSHSVFPFRISMLPIGSPGYTRKVGCPLDGMQDPMELAHAVHVVEL